MSVLVFGRGFWLVVVDCIFLGVFGFWWMFCWWERTDVGASVKELYGCYILICSFGCLVDVMFDFGCLSYNSMFLAQFGSFYVNLGCLWLIFIVLVNFGGFGMFVGIFWLLVGLLWFAFSWVCQFVVALGLVALGLGPVLSRPPINVLKFQAKCNPFIFNWYEIISQVLNKLGSMGGTKEDLEAFVKTLSQEDLSSYATGKYDELTQKYESFLTVNALRFYINFKSPPLSQH